MNRSLAKMLSDADMRTRSVNVRGLAEHTRVAELMGEDNDET